jgi:hypothetical protein
MLAQAVRRGLALGLTGIGYDGEERDTVTLLPKPRILVPAGAFLTTAESCLAGTEARWTDLRHTGIGTALGEVVIVRIVSPGVLVVAGPNKTHELEEIRRTLAREGLDLLMVDGSLNRIAPMAVADRLVFSTGGARSTDPQRVAGEMRAIASLFRLPVEGREAEVAGPVLTAGTPQAEAIAASHGDDPVIRWRGLAALHTLSAIAPQAGKRGASIVFDDPFKLLLAGEVHRVAALADALRQAGVRLACRRSPLLAAVTCNPFYPAYDGTVFSPGMLDAAVIQEALRSALDVPVVDVVREGGATLFEAVWNA